MANGLDFRRGVCSQVIALDFHLESIDIMLQVTSIKEIE